MVGLGVVQKMLDRMRPLSAFGQTLSFYLCVLCASARDYLLHFSIVSTTLSKSSPVIALSTCDIHKVT